MRKGVMKRLFSFLMAAVMVAALLPADLKVKAAENDTAVFTVNGTDYTGLQAAINAAGSNKTIILKTSGDIYGNYVIPNGVTLQIPFDSSNTLYTTTPGYTLDYSARTTAYKTLNMIGATITVANGGSLNLGSMVHRQGKGSVGPYGHIAMDTASSITVQSGGKMYAWGYVTGSGKVTVESGGSIWEAMADLDYPGSATSANSVYSAGAFPLRNYTVRNVEPELTVKAGGTENIYTHLYGTSAGEFPISFVFIGSSSGFFRLSNGSITKSYSGGKSYYTVNGNASINSMSIRIKVLIMYKTLSTSDVSGVPIPSNYIINIVSGTTTLNENVLLLENTRLNIAEGATLSIPSGKNLYVFDGADDLAGSAVDAVLDINGTLTAKGGFYTTTHDAQVISSNKTGKVTFTASAGTASSVKIKRSGTTVDDVAITAASLLNGDGSYTETAGAVSGDSFTYCADHNKWEKNHAAYTVTFKANGGTGGDYTQSICSLGGNLASNTFTRNDYAFTGWNTAANGSGTAYTDQQPVTLSGNLTLYAQWAVSHDFGAPTYEWAADYTSVTATRVCRNDSSHVETETVSATGIVTTAATCTAAGVRTWTSAAFTNTAFTVQSKEETLPALGHDFGAWTVTAPATCTEDGVETRTCNRCSATETRPVAAFGHDYVAAVTPPTCTEQGYTTLSCNHCGDSYVDTYVDALGHNFGEWTVTTSATCTEAGVETHTCSRCSVTETRPVDPLGHDWDYAHAVFNWNGQECQTATVKCTRDASHEMTVNVTVTESAGTGDDVGYWIYTASFTAGGETYTDVKKVEGHYHDGILFKPWNNATSLPTEAGHYYLTCDVTLSSKWYASPGVTDLCLNGHSITGQIELAGDDPDQVVLDLYDCENTGKLTVSGGTLLNISSNATFNMYGGSISGCNHSGECIRVMFDTSVFNMYAGSIKNNKGSFIVNGSGHFNMYGGTISNNTGIGVNVANFSISGSPVIRNNKVTSGGTETEKNVYFMALSKIEIAGELTEGADIGITLNRTLTCAAPYVFTNGLSGKGDASAFTSDQGYLIRVNNDGEAEMYLEHSWGEWTVTTPATCTEEGVETRECSVCHATETRPVEALGHTEEVMPAVPATCTATGLTEGKRCSVCGEILVAQQETPALGHDWDYAHAVFNWNGQECTTATVKCSRDASHEMTVNVTVTESAGTGDDAGYWIYTASFTADGETYTDVKKVEGHFHDSIMFTPWNNATSLPTAAGNYYLTVDVTLNSTWFVPTGRVNLCLNGHTVRLAEGKTGSVIRIASGAALGLYDCGTEGVITGGNNRSGAGVYVEGTFDMYGGSISGNTTSGSGAQVGGAGVYVYGASNSAGKFNLHGGTISNNTASNSNAYGGGVFVGGMFNMSGGTISGNSSTSKGGGVAVYGNSGISNFTMTGGTISNNTATYGGGVFVDSYFKVSGSPVVSGNTNSNVYISGATYTGTVFNIIVDGALTGEASLGVTHATAPTCTAPVVITTSLSGKGALSNFTSDNANYSLELNDNGEAQLTKAHTLVKTAAKEATCTEAGNTEYWKCSVCGKYFGDAAGETEIEENSWVIDALGHNYEAAVTPPTCTEDGYTTYTCSRCGDSYTDNYVDALGHIWKAPVWNWDGHASATATFVCERDENHKEILTAQIKSEQGTGTDVGKTVYTATVVGPDGETYTDVLKETNTYTVTWLNWNGDELEVDTDVPYGSTPSYDGDEPSRPQDAQYTYEFKGWDPVPGTVTGDVTYTATYTPSLRSYNITWLNEDGSQIDTTTVAYGTLPTHEAPTKPATAQYTYVFDGWDPTPVAVTGEATYRAKFRAEVNEYTVTFKNWDGEVLQSSKVPYGTVPSYSGTPAREADAQYTYAFAGWSPEVTAVIGDATYMATYTPTTRTYTVTWKNWDGQTLETDTEVPYGTVPTYDGDEPKREGDEQYTYTFTGWDPAVGAITGDTVYTAQFGEDVNTYTVTWKNWDGTVLETDTEVVYGATPQYNGSTPARESTAQFSYEFAGWTPAITQVTGNITYTATFTETVRTYTVIWKNDDGQVLETDTEVAYGATPEYNGATPTKASTAQYSYEFAGWTPSVASVTGDATYTATYTATTRSYTVVWKNWNGDILETDNNVLYGATPSYDSAEPTREGNAQYSYAFKGWTPEVTEVKGDAEYTAVFQEKTNSYTVTWKNWNGEELEVDDNVPYGTTPSYDGTQPAKAPDQTGHYSFTGWSPEVAAVTEDAVYTAVFASAAHTYGEPEWVWTGTDGGYTASAVFTCSHCGYQLTVLADEPSYEVTKEPTVNEAGEGTYTATVTGPDGEPYTGTKVVEIAKLEAWHIIVTDYTKGAAATTINADALYRGENTFTATCAYDNDGEIIDAGCVIAIDNGNGTYTKLAVTTVDGVHSFMVNVMDADVRLVIVLKGDANLNGVVDTRDMTRIQNAYLEVPGKELTALQALAADANGDGTADGKDMTRIQKAYLGMIVMPW